MIVLLLLLPFSRLLLIFEFAIVCNAFLLLRVRLCVNTAAQRQEHRSGEDSKVVIVLLHDFHALILCCITRLDWIEKQWPDSFRLIFYSRTLLALFTFEIEFGFSPAESCLTGPGLAQLPIL